MNNQLVSHTTTEYRAMLLRFSREPADSAWRITVRDVNTSQQLAFATLPELVAYLSTAITNEKENRL